MITTLISDFSKVLLFVKNKAFNGKLNALNKRLAEEMGDYPFFDYFRLNTELLDFYTLLNKKYSISLHIFTTGTIQEKTQLQPFLQPLFRTVFSAHSMRVSKEDPQSYVELAKKVGAKPHEVIFVDDQQVNCDAAQKASMNTVLYSDNETVQKEILQLLQ